MLFEKATRLKLRFIEGVGQISTEDLWSLSLTRLDALARALNKEMRDKEVSFIGENNEATSLVQLRFDVVKHIIDVKLAEKDARKQAEDLRQRKEQLRAALADRLHEDLKSKSVDEIQKELAALG
jgi:hypothetical protein